MPKTYRTRERFLARVPKARIAMRGMPRQAAHATLETARAPSDVSEDLRPSRTAPSISVKALPTTPKRRAHGSSGKRSMRT
jgi:hypothetical protein